MPAGPAGGCRHGEPLSGIGDPEGGASMSVNAPIRHRADPEGMPCPPQEHGERWIGDRGVSRSRRSPSLSLHDISGWRNPANCQPEGLPSRV